jgi:hypothetical protein
MKRNLILAVALALILLVVGKVVLQAQEQAEAEARKAENRRIIQLLRQYHNDYARYNSAH